MPQIADMRAIAELWTSRTSTLTVIATRGERLALTRVRFSDRDQRPERFCTEVLSIVEIDADERIVAHVTFDPDDIDAAFEELDARYLAGEAAAHAHTWSVIARAYAAVQPARDSADDTGLGQHRPSAGSPRSRRAI